MLITNINSIRNALFVIKW